MDGWFTRSFPFGKKAYFLGATGMLVSGGRGIMLDFFFVNLSIPGSNFIPQEEPQEPLRIEQITKTWLMNDAIR